MTEDRTLTQSEIDQRVFDLYDEYCHGQNDRRAFFGAGGDCYGGRAGDGAGFVAALRPRPNHIVH